MRKPRIKRVYSQLFGGWYWCVSWAPSTGWERITWQETRAFQDAQRFVDKLNRKQIKGN